MNKKLHFINKNNGKLLLITTFRNRRIAKFCKKLRRLHVSLSSNTHWKQTADVENYIFRTTKKSRRAPTHITDFIVYSLSVSIAKNFLLSCFLSCIAPANASPRPENCYTSSTNSNEKLCQSSPWSVPILQSYDQNKFQLFLLIKTIEKIAIFKKSFLGPIKQFLIFFFGKRENTT